MSGFSVFELKIGEQYRQLDRDRSPLPSRLETIYLKKRP